MKRKLGNFSLAPFSLNQKKIIACWILEEAVFPRASCQVLGYGVDVGNEPAQSRAHGLGRPTGGLEQVHRGLAVALTPKEGGAAQAGLSKGLRVMALRGSQPALLPSLSIRTWFWEGKEVNTAPHPAVSLF